MDLTISQIDAPVVEPSTSEYAPVIQQLTAFTTGWGQLPGVPADKVKSVQRGLRTAANKAGYSLRWAEPTTEADGTVTLKLGLRDKIERPKGSGKKGDAAAPAAS